MTKKALTIPDLEIIATDIRASIIRMLEEAGSGHSAGPLGLADIYTALYFSVLNHDPKNPDWEDRDILLTSNGHTVPVRYASMAHCGYFPVSELMTLRKFGSRLQGHPERTRLPGLENTSGPLGSGLSQACGIAIAFQHQKQVRRRVFCILGDGELDEGNVWEAAMLAGSRGLSNIIGVIDRNNIQIDGMTENVMKLEDLRGKWEAFGWRVLEVDGNNIEAVIDVLTMARSIIEKPVMIIAYTIPGKGVDFMEFDYKWHGMPPNHEQAKIALHELRTLKGKIVSEHQ
jgi:transketolase